MDYSVTSAVNAKPQVVWDLFVAVERWPTLSASMRGVRRLDHGPLRVGSVAVIDQPRLPAARWRVTTLDPGRSFFWESSALGVTSIGGHLVEAKDEGSIVTLTFKQVGPLAGLLGVMFGRLARRYIAMELDGFKLGAESR